MQRRERNISTRLVKELGNSPATFHSLKLDITEKGIISGDITKMLREGGAYFAKLYAKLSLLDRLRLSLTV